MTQPTIETYDELQKAYDHFNKALFRGRLPQCLITLQRKASCYGYFCPKRFVAREGELYADEIAMNPEFFVRSIEEVLSTLVHEMVHLWQAHFGSPGRGRYHNGEWADQMEALGLQPTDGNGKRTGDHMSHTIIEGGPFAKACKELMAENYTLGWVDIVGVILAGLKSPGAPGEPEPEPPKKAARQKYTCPDCGANAWGKPDLSLLCGSCPDNPELEPV